MLEIRGLTKRYGRHTVVDDLSFECGAGEMLGFLGPNGAGKSTTMKILTGTLAADHGEALVAGLSVAENRIEVAARLGYLPENGPLYDEMTPRGLLRFLGEARGLEGDHLEQRIDAVVREVELESVLGKSISKLSRGFRQRVGLAQALIHEPDVLILDEPTTGLDPNQIRHVRQTIRDLGRNKAVLLSTHILQEVEAVADRVVFINEGEIVFTGSVADLRESAASLDEAFAQYTRQPA